MRKSGWFRESQRHSLASRGIKTAQKIPKINNIKGLSHWQCASCGASNIGGEQCSVCDFKKAEQWVCESCGSVNMEEYSKCQGCDAERED